jgi:predicted GNAT superfamily acetyltransferase
LQRVTWGARFGDLVRPTMLMIAQKMGGIAAGAFDEDDDMAGFVFGITGWREGAPSHWSHMLAVQPGWQNLGVGARLKQYQRASLLASGVPVMMWSFDPLVARNAHLNLVRVGARVREYVRDLYEPDPHNTMDTVIGTDRFIVEWELAGAAPPSMDPFDAADDIPVVEAEVRKGVAHPRVGDFTTFPTVRIEIPEDIQRLKKRHQEVAISWRLATREAFLWYLDRHYSVIGLVGDATSHRRFYRLKAPGNIL